MIIPKGTVVTIDGKVYRTLEAQVAWNKEELESLDIDTLEGLPDQFTELQENLSALSDHVDDVEDDVDDLKSDMTQAQFDIDQVEGDVSAIGTQLSGKQAKYHAVQITLEPSDWTLHATTGFECSKTVQGVTATNLVQVSPDTSSIDDYSDNNIVCTSQLLNTLVFHALDISSPPATNILVNIVVWEE